jgi:hypothetical protein
VSHAAATRDCSLLFIFEKLLAAVKCISGSKGSDFLAFNSIHNRARNGVNAVAFVPSSEGKAEDHQGKEAK